jgi:hypothetical protein
MSHPFHDYLASQLEKMLRDDRVVVFYDPRGEFESFLEELEAAGTGRGDLPLVEVHGLKALLARFEGSFFVLKATLEPNTELDTPDPLLVYLPGVERDRHGSVLMELEKGGRAYEPQLKRLALNALRKQYTDGDIDEMLAPENLTYQDLVRFLDQSGGGQPSLLKLVLGEGPSEVLLTRWLADDTFDEGLEAKQAVGELYKLVAARLGFALEAGTDLTKARHQTLRFALVNEFRSDLSCDPPANLSLVPGPPTKEERQRVSEVVGLLRQEHPERYTAISDTVEAELDLAKLGIEEACLGSVDTFRFEERLLLGWAAQLLEKEDYAGALQLVTERGRSFWVDRDVERQAQWEACRLLAELGEELRRVRGQLKKAGGDAGKWVEAYAGDGEWFRVDLAQRLLEAWIAKMDEEPEPSLEKALGLLRSAYETLLKDMAEGFTEALSANGWTVPGVLHQTRVFPEVVEAAGGRVAYFLVDALRYEMGADLAEQLRDAVDLRLVPAVTALPSITPIGMAALLPGASTSFTVVDHKGKLAARIEDSVLPGVAERRKFLKARRPEAREIDLGELLHKSTNAIQRKLENAPLVVVRSQSIDGLGEMDGGHLARQLMDTLVGNVARAVRKLAKVGVEHFVISADHGHQFSLRKEEDMTLDKPGGDTVELHRRCWAGRGGQTPGACVRVYAAGGDLAYHHGGVSLQEMVVPVLSLRMPVAEEVAPSAGKLTIEGYPTVLTNRTFGMRLFFQGDLFTQEAVPVRLVILAEGQEVGQTGMAPGEEFDRRTGKLLLPPGKVVSVGMMLTREGFERVRIVAQDPSTDAVLAQTEEIPVKLGI